MPGTIPLRKRHWPFTHLLLIGGVQTHDTDVKVYLREVKGNLSIPKEANHSKACLNLPNKVSKYDDFISRTCSIPLVVDDYVKVVFTAIEERGGGRGAGTERRTTS